MTKQPSSKNPLGAAALNLIPVPFALGYAYIGDWKRSVYSAFNRIFVFVFVGLVAFGVAWLKEADAYISSSDYQANYASALLMTLLVVGGILPASGWNAYRAARLHNELVAEWKRAFESPDN